MDLVESLRPYHAAVLAFLVALGAPLLARWLRWPHLVAVAAGLGVLAGWWLTFGLLTATPRQLPERLPLLVLVMVLATPALGMAARRWRGLELPAALLGACWVGWWMAGAPRVPADLARGWPVLGGVAAAALLLALRSAPGWAGPLATASLFAGLAAAALPGPQLVSASVLLAAALGAALAQAWRGGGATGPLSALPLAGGIAALAAIPVLARGAPADWTAAAAPLAALLLGAPAGARMGGRLGAPIGAALVGATATLVAFLVR